ncbi:MAG: phenylalanine--tRNA ligase beta subunit-related protein, partial [Endomicrobiia bacterium]
SVDNNTKNIVIESALFNKEMVRKTRKDLGISTEASYRFERGSGLGMCDRAAFRTIQLVLLYCGGQLTKFIDLKDVQYQQSLNKKLKVNLKFISELLGMDVVEDDLLKVVKSLGGEIIFAEKQTGNYVIIPPNSRLDWVYQADVAEEIARFKGYDNIEDTFPAIFNTEPEDKKYELFIKQIRQYFVSAGFSQVMNYSLCSESENKLFKNYDKQKIVVSNPLSQEYSQMRLSLFSGLIKNFITNKNNQINSVLLYEVGKIYYKTDDKIIEEEQVGFIISGEEKEISWKNNVLKYDRCFSIGLVETLLKNLGLKYRKTYPEIENSIPVNKFTGQISDIIEYIVEDKTVSFICEIDRTKLNLKTNYPIFYGEIYVEQLYKTYKIEKKFVPLVKYPFVLRDLSLVINQDISYEQILDIIKTFSDKNKQICEIVDIDLFDYYKKDTVTYITLSLKFQSEHKTLTDEEVNKIFFELVDVLKLHKIELRQ